MSNEKFKVKFGLAVGDTAATIDGTTGEVIAALGNDGQVITGAGGGDNGRIEIGKLNRSTAGTPYIDFHSSATANDFDVRMIASGGTALNDGSGTLTIYAADIVHSGDLTINGNLQVDGNTTLGSNSSDTVAVNGLVNNNITFSNNSTTTNRGITGTVGANDYWKYGGGATGSDAGYAEIATGDNGTEPIYARQFNAGTPRTLTLMDASGNTQLAGDLTVAGTGYIYSSTNLALQLTGADVKVLGNLDVQGGSITDSTGALTISTGGAFTSTGSSISGNTLTIGTVTSGTVAVGQTITGGTTLGGTVITSGSGSTWTVSGPSQTVASSALNGDSNVIITPTGNGIIDLTKNVTADLGLSVAKTTTGGGKAVDTNGDVLVINSTVNTTQTPVAAVFDNTTANRNGRVIVREYGQNTGNLATSSTVGQANIIFEASRGTGTAPTNVNTANNTVANISGGYYDGTRFTSENGFGNPITIALQNSEATASETSSFTASISGTTMTVTAVSGSNNIHVGQLLTGTGVAVGTTITAYGSNTFGGVGTYTVSFSQTVASTTVTGVGTTAGGGRIIQVITPTGNKLSAASRQTIYVTTQAAPTTSTVNTVSVPVNAALNMINGNAETADATYVNTAGTVVYKARGGGTFGIPTLNFQMQGVTGSDTCSFTGYIDNGAGSAGNTLTVTAVSSGSLYGAPTGGTAGGMRVFATALSNTTPYFIQSQQTAATAAVATTTATGTSGTPTITVASATGIDQGQFVVAAGVPANTFVITISGTTITLSNNLTAPLSATAIDFYTPGLQGTYTLASTFQTAGTTVGSSGSPVAMVGGPDDYGLLGKGNSIDSSTYRKSTVASRRAPLKSGDDIFRINSNAQVAAVGTNTTRTNGILRFVATEDYTTSASGNRFDVITTTAGTNTTVTALSVSSESADIRANTVNLKDGTGTTTATFNNTAKTLNMSSGSTTTLNIGDVNIAQMGSTWQSAFAPGFKYTGLASSSTLTNNGTLFEMSARWKANAATAVFDPPQNGWGIGSFAFSADNSTTGTSQIAAGNIKCEASENWTSTATGTELSFVANRAGVLNQGRKVLSMTPEQIDIIGNTISFSDDATSTNLATFDTTKAAFTVPVQFPVKTAAQWNAITGAVGQQVCVSDSPVVAGKMAYWSSTATAGWRYIDTNTAI